MPKSFVCSDHHFGHANIIKFVDDKGQRIRQFDSIDEHDFTIIKLHNELVAPTDRVYFLGDVAINKKFIHRVAQMNGKKILIRGNHDIFELSDYTTYFDDVRAYKMYPKHGFILSHIPVHTSQLDNKFKINIHGHLHQNLVGDDRYINVCLEHTGFKPVPLDDLISGKFRNN